MDLTKHSRHMQAQQHMPWLAPLARKFILAKTHLFEQSVGASDPYGKWPLGAGNAWNENSLGWGLICRFWKHALALSFECTKAVECTTCLMLSHTFLRSLGTALVHQFGYPTLYRAIAHA